ncbi:MAG: hypothetical protein UV00_C0024G0014 [candidate division WWE3 bacterium GW2011_GWF1_42_14]|uniref:Rhamnogalacturonase A/B/Epimerase-like pectate lyase domain-containing protein n=1 Tax=candidate division WWE3 bacterium GW2011_GWF1_42_14 TaxID=1619138 RepID=A0A0G0YJ88_UNCKA|nr:MAG: hypothetical protein UV00_C0024G0014 [candidate division WWE3 bacterium GW2011_GWF1_42_14]
MPRLPSVGGDDGNWGTILNSYLAQEHNTDGSHKKHAVTDTGGQVYNVKAFGAMGNGTTDDTTSIINTLTACASGGVVYLPPGTYLISNTINITNNNVTLMGAGAGATTIKAAAGSEGLAMIIVGNGTDTLAHTTIAKILFTSQNQKTANQAIKLQKAFKTWIYNVRIEKQYNGIFAFNSTETFFRDSDIRDTTNDAIVWENALQSGYDFYINNVVADNPEVTNTGNGISWLGGENFVIQNCDFLHFKDGFHIHPATSHHTRFGFFINAEFDFASDNNININNTDGGDIIGLTFTNTWTGTATNYGVLISDNGSGEIQGIRFIGHKSFHNGLAGFRLAGGDDIHLLGCDVVGNSQTSANTRSGIELSAGVGSNCSIVGCKSGNGFQQGNTQSYGINIDGSHTYTNINISSNELDNNTNGGINLNDAVIAEGKIVNNTGRLVNQVFEAGTPEIWLTNTTTNHTSKILDDGNLHIEGENQNIWINGATNANVLLATGGGKVGIGNDNPGSKLSITGLPTSAAGLSAGDVWNNNGVLNIVS